MSSVPKGGGRGIDGTLQQKNQYGQHVFEYPNPTLNLSNNQHVVQESAHMYRVAVEQPRGVYEPPRYMPPYTGYYAPEFVPSVPFINQVMPATQVQAAPTYVPPERKKVLTICDPSTGLPINLNKDEKKKKATPDTKNVAEDADVKADLIRKEMNKKVLNEIKKKPENASGVCVPTGTVVFNEAAAPPVYSPVKVAQATAPPVVDAQAAPQVAPASALASTPAPTPAAKKEATPVPEPVEKQPVPVGVPIAEPVVEAKSEQAITEKVEVPIPVETEKAPVVKDTVDVPENASVETPAESASSETLEDGEIVDDPETEVDAEEEARRKEAEEAEKRREREKDLDELKERLLNDINEVSLANNCYGRAFLYCVRDIEKEFKRTTCPLSQKELENFGIDILSMPKGSDKKRQDFNPSWAVRSSGSGPRTGRGAQYSGRSSHNEHRGGRNSGNKKPYSGKGLSIDRPMEKKINLSHKAEDAWKPDKFKAEENEDDNLRNLLRKVRALLNKITPTTKEELIKEFISFKICKVPQDAKYKAKDQLAEVVNIIFDKAVEEPKFCPLYSELCKRQVDEELAENSKLSELRNALLNRAQATFVNRDFQETFAAKMKAMQEEADPKLKAQLITEIEEFEGKFRRRKFGNIIFIGQLYCQQLLSTKIVNWCLYDLIKHTHKTNECLPEPPYDEESLQCAVQMLESLGKQLESANDFPGKQYLDQTLGHLKEISQFCSNRIRFMILGIIELRSNKWQQRKVVDQGPKKITEIHNEIKQEQMENLQQRESYDKRQGLRTGGGSLRRQAPPPMRNSSDNRYGQGKQDKRAAAAASSKLTTTHAPPRNMSLSQVAQEDKRKTWKTGASGGGVSQESSNRVPERWNKNSSRDGSENRKLSSADDKAAAIAAAHRMGSTDQRSPSQMSSASQDNEESQEDNQERERLMQRLAKSISSDLAEVEHKEMSIEEMSNYLYANVGQEKYGKPTISDVFQRLMQSAVECITANSLPTLGHVLCKALQESKNKTHALAGIANYCTYAVKTDAWCDYPKVVWGGIAEVIINSIFCETALFEGPRPCLNDFAESFINASKDSREDHPYELLVTVLRMMAEKNVQLAGEDHHTSSSMTFHELSFLPSLESDRLKAALKACPAPENTGFSSLHALLEHL